MQAARVVKDDDLVADTKNLNVPPLAILWEWVGQMRLSRFNRVDTVLPFKC